MKSHYVAAPSGGRSGHPTRSVARCILLALTGVGLFFWGAPTPGRAAETGAASRPKGAPAGGTQAPSSAAMLRTARENVSTSLHTLLPRANTPRGCLDGVKRLSEERRTAQRVIAAQYALDDMPGIILADGYDELFVAAVDTLTQAFLMKDNDLPESEAGDYFTREIADLPPLNETPAAFIVAFVIMRCVQVAQSPPATLSAATRDAVREVAVRAVAAVAQKYRESRAGGDARQKADEFRQASVIDRVRCHTHNSPYTIKELRNGMRKDGSFYRRYVAVCQAGQESRNFDFDLEALNQLTRNGGIQVLPPRLPTPETRQPGVDQ